MCRADSAAAPDDGGKIAHLVSLNRRSRTAQVDSRTSRAQPCHGCGDGQRLEFGVTWQCVSTVTGSAATAGTRTRHAGALRALAELWFGEARNGLSSAARCAWAPKPCAACAAAAASRSRRQRRGTGAQRRPRPNLGRSGHADADAVDAIGRRRRSRSPAIVRRRRGARRARPALALADGLPAVGRAGDGRHQSGSTILVLWIITAITLFVLALLLIVIVQVQRASPIRRRRARPTTRCSKSPGRVIPVRHPAGDRDPVVPLLFVQLNIPPSDLTVKATGKQWYWTYSYPDEKFEFNSIMLQDDGPRRSVRTSRACSRRQRDGRAGQQGGARAGHRRRT